MSTAPQIARTLATNSAMPCLTYLDDLPSLDPSLDPRLDPDRDMPAPAEVFTDGTLLAAKGIASEADKINASKLTTYAMVGIKVHEAAELHQDGVQQETEQWYRSYYEKKGADRNDPLANPGVLFQTLAFQRSVVEALRRIPADRRHGKVLDVGCGGGSSLLNLISYGMEPERLYGVDIVPERIATGKRRFPALNLRLGDARELDYADGFFDLAMESTMFVQITDEAMASRIAEEMLRVVKPGGYILLTDWRYSFGKKDYQALSMARIRRLFNVGNGSRVVCRIPGALIPPLGRTLSRLAPSLYFLTARLFPAVVGQVSVILQKA